MVPAVKELWLTALRSDKYNQGHGQLKQIKGGETSYCCLGVLYEIATVVGVASHSTSNAIENDVTQCRFICPDEIPEAHWLSPTMREWSGLNIDEIKRLAELNDQSHRTFAEIATRIERYL